MKKIPAYFACTTPYQIIGAIDIVLSKHLVADLYIFGMFKNHEKVAEKLNDRGVFRKVIDVSPNDYKIKNPNIDGTIQVICAKSIVRNFLDDDLCYDTYYYTSYAHLKVLLEHVLLMRNPKMRSVIYDDGTGTYSRNSGIYEISPLRKKLEKFLGWKQIPTDSTSFLVREPELLCLPAKYQDCCVEKMTTVTEQTKDISKKIFSVDEKKVIKEKVIIFDMLRGTGRVAAETLEKLDHYYSLIADAFESDNVICKPHPRSRLSSEVEIKQYTDTEIPMEILYSEMQNLENRVLVSYSSTALFTPKMLFGKEPVIISLHKLLPIGESYSDLFERFRMSYEDRKLVFTPNTEQELEECLRTLKT